MANESADGDGDQVPDAVMDWLSSVAAERGQSEAELLQSLLAGTESDAGGEAASDRELEHVEREFRDLVQDVRDRIVQVKRETDEKAPGDHTHHDLRNTLEQLGREVGALEAHVEQLDDRLSGGFENYEEILTYLTDTSDELNRRLVRLASAVINLREQVGEAARDEVRRTALSHLTDAANRHGIDTAKCEDCGEAVDLSLLVDPRCPHCESTFSTIEPKSGFFRSSVLHTGTMPALESAGEAPASEDDALQSLVDEAATQADEPAPDIRTPAPTAREPAKEAEPTEGAGEEPETAAADDEEADPATESGRSDEPAASAPAEATADDPDTAAPEDQAASDVDPPEPGDANREADGDLQSLDGIGPAYADRLESAGIDGLLALAVAEPEELSEAIDVPESTVEEWVGEADTRTGGT